MGSSLSTGGKGGNGGKEGSPNNGSAGDDWQRDDEDAIPNNSASPALPVLAGPDQQRRATKQLLMVSLISNRAAKKRPAEDSGTSAVGRRDKIARTGTLGGPVICIDLICHAAAFINTGNPLMNLCISVGPIDASKIRRNYLQDNDRYLESILQRLYSLGKITWTDFKEHRGVFDTCRDKILAWMEVNDNWRSRCTPQNMKMYESLLLKANLIFNNPAVAMEIGLHDVVRFVVEKKNIDVNARSWEGFNTSTLIMELPTPTAKMGFSSYHSAAAIRRLWNIFFPSSPWTLRN